MGTVVNLRRARKARARAERTGEAAANAARHGVPKAERTRTQAEADKARRALDGHALNRDRIRDPAHDDPARDSDRKASGGDDPADP